MRCPNVPFVSHRHHVCRRGHNAAAHALGLGKGHMQARRKQLAVLGLQHTRFRQCNGTTRVPSPAKSAGDDNGNATRVLTVVDGDQSARGGAPVRMFRGAATTSTVKHEASPPLSGADHDATHGRTQMRQHAARGLTMQLT